MQTAKRHLKRNREPRIDTSFRPEGRLIRIRQIKPSLRRRHKAWWRESLDVYSDPREAQHALFWNNVRWGAWER